MAGRKSYGVYRRRPDYLRHTRRKKPITITGPPAPSGRIMSSMAGSGGLAGSGGIAGQGGGLAG